MDWSTAHQPPTKIGQRDPGVFLGTTDTGVGYQMLWKDDSYSKGMIFRSEPGRSANVIDGDIDIEAGTDVALNATRSDDGTWKGTVQGDDDGTVRLKRDGASIQGTIESDGGPSTHVRIEHTASGTWTIDEILRDGDTSASAHYELPREATERQAVTAALWVPETVNELYAS
jgi:hypothetical protein